MDLQPGNTLPSFKEALENSEISMIEMDVRKNQKEEIIVAHDKIKDEKEKALRLETALDLINRIKKVNIELKSGDTEHELARTIRNYLQKGWVMEDFLVSSFYPWRLVKIKKILPEVPVGLVVEKNLPLFPFIMLAKTIGAISIHPHFTSVKQKQVRKAHEKGLKVFCHTLTEKSEIQRMREIGVDGVFVNNPIFASSILKEL